jgi:hypothetical protein
VSKVSILRDFTEITLLITSGIIGWLFKAKSMWYSGANFIIARVSDNNLAPDK